MVAPNDSLGGSSLLLSPNQPHKSHFKPTPQGLKQSQPFPSSTKTLSPLKMKNQNRPTPEGNIQVSRWFISKFKWMRKQSLKGCRELCHKHTGVELGSDPLVNLNPKFWLISPWQVFRKCLISRIDQGGR